MKNIFFIGINGIGMSGIAKIMKYKSYNVSGSDISRSYVTEEMEKMGINIYPKHSKLNIKNSDTIIASTAIKENNPEYQFALENNLTVMRRGELLANLLNKEEGIAIAGTHGKTTTSSMMACSMLSLDPTVVIGGILPEINSNARAGASSYFVAEADESDNSFLYMKPKYSVITNIERDHLDVHENLENIKDSFRQFIEQTEKEVVVCVDCENIRSLINVEDKKITTYSIKDESANIYAKNINVQNGKTNFEVIINAVSYGDFSLSIPGEHNVQNALPVIYFSTKFGTDLELVKAALAKFKGSKRRYDILFHDPEKNIKVIDDYAHHPTEVIATLNGVTSIEKGEIIAIFQPHRYSRVKLLLNEFKSAFNKADHLFLMPIYAAGEEDSFGVSLEQLKEEIENKQTDILLDEKILKKYIMTGMRDKTLVFMGAGDISKFAHDISEYLEERREII